MPVRAITSMFRQGLGDGSTRPDRLLLHEDPLRDKEENASNSARFGVRTGPEQTTKEPTALSDDPNPPQPDPAAAPGGALRWGRSTDTSARQFPLNPSAIARSSRTLARIMCRPRPSPHRKAVDNAPAQPARLRGLDQ